MVGYIEEEDDVGYDTEFSMGSDEMSRRASSLSLESLSDSSTCRNRRTQCSRITREYPGAISGARLASFCSDEENIRKLNTASGNSNAGYSSGEHASSSAREQRTEIIARRRQSISEGLTGKPTIKAASVGAKSSNRVAGAKNVGAEVKLSEAAAAIVNSVSPPAAEGNQSKTQNQFANAAMEKDAKSVLSPTSSAGPQRCHPRFDRPQALEEPIAKSDRGVRRDMIASSSVSECFISSSEGSKFR